MKYKTKKIRAAWAPTSPGDLGITRKERVIDWVRRQFDKIAPRWDRSNPSFRAVWYRGILDKLGIKRTATEKLIVASMARQFSEDLDKKFLETISSKDEGDLHEP